MNNTDRSDAPDEWDEQRYEEHGQQLDARWQSDNGEISVTANSIEDEPGSVHYVVSVEQHIEADGYGTTIQTHERHVGTKDEAVGAAVEFMLEAQDGEHVEHCQRADIWQDEWVQFYCINESNVPDELDVQRVIDAIEGTPAEESEMTDKHPGLDDESVVEADAKLDVSIYPRHISVVSTDHE